VPGYLFLAAFGDNAQAAATAEFARSDINASRAFVITDSSMEYTRLLSQYFSEQYTATGGVVSGNASYDGNFDNYAAAIAGAGISGAQPDAVFIACGPQDCGNVTRAVRAAGISAPVLGGDSMDSPALAMYAGPDAGKIFFTTHADIGNDSGDRNMAPFIAEYEQKFNETPTAFAALGYDTVNLVAEAARLSPSTDLRDGIWAIRGYDGLAGTYSYANRAFIPQKSVTIMELKNGTMVSHGEWIPRTVPVP
jgi:branched-chain amino acid transport system substrate-binding protein